MEFTDVVDGLDQHELLCMLLLLRNCILYQRGMLDLLLPFAELEGQAVARPHKVLVQIKSTLKRTQDMQEFYCKKHHRIISHMDEFARSFHNPERSILGLPLPERLAIFRKGLDLLNQVYFYVVIEMPTNMNMNIFQTLGQLLQNKNVVQHLRGTHISTVYDIVIHIVETILFSREPSSLLYRERGLFFQSESEYTPIRNWSNLPRLDMSSATQRGTPLWWTTNEITFCRSMPDSTSRCLRSVKCEHLMPTPLKRYGT